METRNSLNSCNEDRISNLPDSLIHHILSFLDIYFALQTCVLSRRWRYIWTSLPSLNFDCDSFERNNRRSRRNISFINFVDMVLILHDRPDLLRFRLKWCGYKTKHVNTWILSALRRNVQDLSVYIKGDIAFQVPQCLFNCQSLTKLELETSCERKPKIILPKSIDLPQLKSLKLYGTSINDVNIIINLMSSCPVLQSLMLHCSDIVTDDLLNLNFDSAKLKHFELSNCRYLCSSRYIKSNCMIRLCAPNLTSLVWNDCLSHEYSLENLSSLVTAEIEMIAREGKRYMEPKKYSEIPAKKKKVYANRMMKFLRALHNVKELTLSAGFLELVSRAPDLFNSRPPQFRNLRCLNLEMWGSKGCFRAMTYLLKISRNLESLSLRISESSFRNEKDGWETELSLPCMFYHLKFLQVRGLGGLDNELKFLEFLMKNAIVLEELVLYSRNLHSSPGMIELREFYEKLNTFPRASSISTIYVIETEW